MEVKNKMALTEKAVPSAQRLRNDEGYDKVTSISAHRVVSIAVTMSISEMETLIDLLHRSIEFGVPKNQTEHAIINELASSVESLR